MQFSRFFAGTNPAGSLGYPRLVAEMSTHQFPQSSTLTNSFTPMELNELIVQTLLGILPSGG
jgi:hypothetical protein